MVLYKARRSARNILIKASKKKGFFKIVETVANDMYVKKCTPSVHYETYKWIIKNGFRTNFCAVGGQYAGIGRGKTNALSSERELLKTVELVEDGITVSREPDNEEYWIEYLEDGMCNIYKGKRAEELIDTVPRETLHTDYIPIAPATTITVKNGHILMGFEEFQCIAVEGAGVQNDSENVWVEVGGIVCTIPMSDVLDHEESEPFEASAFLESNLTAPAWDKLYEEYIGQVCSISA